MISECKMSEYEFWKKKWLETMEENETLNKELGEAKQDALDYCTLAGDAACDNERLEEENQKLKSALEEQKRYHEDEVKYYPEHSNGRQKHSIHIKKLNDVLWRDEVRHNKPLLMGQTNSKNTPTIIC